MTKLSTIEAMKPIVIHLLGITAVCHEGFSDNFRGGGFVYIHSTKLGTIGFIASAKMLSSLK